MGEYIDDHIEACINPKMLEWARRSVGYEDEEDAAKKLGIEKATLVSWERGESPLTLLQLRKMSNLYSLPTALFSLREIPSFDFPHKREHITDCRYLSGEEVGRYSPELVLEIARGVDRRAFVLDLFKEAGEKPDKFDFRAKESDGVEDCANRIREIFGFGSVLRGKNRREFFSNLRVKIESSGILVFGMSDVLKDESSGFSYWFDELPVIVVNVNLDLTLRIMSLLRELTHLLLKKSVVSRIDEHGLSYARDDKVEHFCDSVVREVLLPREIFGSGRRDWSVSEIDSLSRECKVKPSVVLDRMNLLGFLDIESYEEKLEKHKKQLQKRKLVRQKSIPRPRISEVVPGASSESGGSRPRRKGREFSPDSVFDEFGHSFVRLVIESCNEDRMTLADASNYLGVNSGHISDVERRLWGY